jgi:hypothetical protein
MPLYVYECAALGKPTCQHKIHRGIADVTAQDVADLIRGSLTR